ncbi:MAG TPA: hypothetical protein GX715_12780 [Armatimonadetes bacterium]|nr:hypothetical protein [Armatimonadota bacterium]
MSTLLVAALLLATPAGERHPILHFSARELPALRARCEADAIRWPRILESADSLTKPGAVSPGGIGAGRDDTPVVVRGHFFGRVLTEQLETLGFAYQITGEGRYGDLGARILIEAARRLPPDAPPVGPGSYAGARGDILRALTTGYDWLFGAMSESERAVVAHALAAYIRSILDEAERPNTWWVPYHNFTGVAVGAAGRAALAVEARFPQEAPRWIAQVERLTRRWLEKGFDEKGAYCEGVLYAAYGLENATLFADALQRSGKGSLFDSPRWKQIPRFLAHSLLPGEPVYDALNDSGYSGIHRATLLRLAGEGDRLARWLWESTGGSAVASPYNLIWANDTPPMSPAEAALPWAEHFPGRGLVIFRTGWGREDLMLSLESGPFYRVTHNQADKCQVTCYGAGGRWLIDSGYGNTREPDGAAQTVAHNLVLIDGKGQAFSGTGTGTNGRILLFEARQTHGYVLGDATQAYQRNASGHPGVALEQAHRHALFVRPGDGVPAYALLADVLRVDGKPHTFDWLLHTAASNEIDAGARAVRLRATPGASGAAYVETPLASKGQGSLLFEVQLPRDGRYRVWARVRASLPEPAKSDSFFVRWDDGKPFAWHAPTSTEWAWGAVTELGAKTPVGFPLSAGRHRLTILTREPGAALDRIAITDAPDWAPGADAVEFEAEAAGAVVAPMRVVREAPGKSAECLIRWLLPEELQISKGTYRDHPRIQARASATDPLFVLLLLPGMKEEAQPETAVRQDAMQLQVTLKWPARIDTITLALDGSRTALFGRQTRQQLGLEARRRRLAQAHNRFGIEGGMGYCDGISR